MVSKILVPIDGSAVTDRVIDVACDLTTSFGAAMTLAHVVALPISTDPGFPIDPTPLEEAGKKILESAIERCRGRGCSAESLMETDVGNAGHGIVRIVREHGFDLIVIGVRGTSKVEALILGSVCDNVTHHAPCPVLVIR